MFLAGLLVGVISTLVSIVIIIFILNAIYIRKANKENKLTSLNRELFLKKEVREGRMLYDEKSGGYYPNTNYVECIE